MKRSHPHADGPHNLERWLLTYADMITLLTAFFLMMYSMSVVSRGKFSALAMSVRSGFTSITQGGTGILQHDAPKAPAGISQENQYRQYRESMQNFGRFVEQHKLGEKVQTRSDERGVIISLLSDGMLFERGSAQLSPDSEQTLQEVAHVLQTVPNQIQVEGHTCDLPIHTVEFPSNWELSTARSGTILRYFTEQAGLPDKRFTASGYADTHPLVANDSEEHRARNRRVDIVLLKTDAQREAELLRQSEIRRVRVPEPTDKHP